MFIVLRFILLVSGIITTVFFFYEHRQSEEGKKLDLKIDEMFLYTFPFHFFF